jgi:DNA invertase Pin-like site-specific DNA recombinase
MRKAKVPVVILVRVSTVKQETDRQISELRAYAKSKDYEIIEVCKETISGGANGDERHGLRRAESLAIEGKVKKVLVHESSNVRSFESVCTPMFS